MQYIKKIILWGIPALILWGFFFFILRTNIYETAGRFLLAFTYAASIFLALIIIQKIIIKRLRIFRPAIQILFKTFFYGAAILIGYLPVLVGEMLYKLSSKEIITEVVYGISKAVSALFALPVTKLEYKQFFSSGVVSVLITIFILLLLTAVLAVGLSYLDTRWTQFHAESRLRESRLKMLEMQMKPHFLFNAINSISSLIRSNPDQAQDLLIRLSEFLRFNFNLGDQAEVILDKEIEFVENYLMLNQARFGNKLTWQIQIDPVCGKINIPGMVIQPLIENTLNHGWQRDENQLHVNLICRKQQDAIIIRIEDNGVGIKNIMLDDSEFPPVGHALHNIRERLRIRYNDNNIMKIESVPGKGTTVTIKIPE